MLSAERIFDRIESEENGEEGPAPSLMQDDNQLARAVDLLKGLKVYQTVPQSNL